MVKLLSALAESRDSVDRNIAFGEAAPRVERLKNIVMVALVVACAILALGYVKMHMKVTDVRVAQKASKQYYVTQLELIERNQGFILRAVGQERASSPSQH